MRAGGGRVLDKKTTAGKASENEAKAMGVSNRKGLIVKIVIGAVAAAVVCAMGVNAYIQSQQGESPIASSSNTTSQNVVQQPPSSVSVPAGSSSEEEPKKVYRWVVEPSLAYDIMMPVPNDDIGDQGTLAFLDVYNGSLWGVTRFDGSVVFEPTYSDGDNAPMVMCGGGLHNVPSPDAVWNSENTNQQLAQAGLPYEVHGGHGGHGPYGFIQHPLTGEMKAFSQGHSPPQLNEDVISQDFNGNTLPAFEYYPGLPGLADDFSNLYEYYQTDYLGLARPDGTILLPAEYTRARYKNGNYALEQNGKWGYYSITTESLITDIIYDMPWQDIFGIPGVGFFNEGLCPVVQNGQYGYIDTKGETVIPLEFEGATHVYNGRAWVKQGGLWGQIEFVRELVEPDITDDSGATYRTTTELNLRYGPGTEYEPPLQVLPTGSAVRLAGYMNSVTDEWIFVDFEGINGWVSTQYIESL